MKVYIILSDVTPNFGTVEDFFTADADDAAERLAAAGEQDVVIARELIGLGEINGSGRIRYTKDEVVADPFAAISA